MKPLLFSSGEWPQSTSLIILPLYMAKKKNKKEKSFDSVGIVHTNVCQVCLLPLHRLASRSSHVVLILVAILTIYPLSLRLSAGLQGQNSSVEICRQKHQPCWATMSPCPVLCPTPSQRSPGRKMTEGYDGLLDFLFISVCPLIALSKAKFAQNVHIVLSSPY